MGLSLTNPVTQELQDKGVAMRSGAAYVHSSVSQEHLDAVLAQDFDKIDWADEAVVVIVESARDRSTLLRFATPSADGPRVLRMRVRLQI